MQVYFYTDMWKVAWFTFLQKKFTKNKVGFWLDKNRIIL